MKVLITGITGFVGPHLASLLIREGYEVCGMIRATNGRENDIRDVVPDEIFKEIEFVYGDLTDFDSIREALHKCRPDEIYHLAAQSHPPTSFKDPLMTLRVNVNGTAHLIEGMRKIVPECKMHNCSTSEVYGAVSEEAGPIKEDFPLMPINPYGMSKAAADMMARERAISCKLDIYVARAFSHTGPRRGSKFSISSDAVQIVRILKGQQSPVIRVGNLESKRVIMDVRDCVNGYYLLMQSFSRGEAYNIGGNILFSIGDFLDKMLEIASLKGKVELKRDESLWRPIDIPVQVCDSTKMRSLTEWKPDIPIEKTLSDLLEYWDEKITTGYK